MSARASGYIKGMIICPNGERLSRAEKLVALVLADSHQDHGRGTFPAVATMAREALMDERVCRRLIASLEQKGVIVRKRGERQGRGQMTFYYFPELDKKEDIGVPLFAAERRTEGGRKGDKKAALSYGRTGTGTSTKATPPTPLVAEGARKAQLTLVECGGNDEAAVERAVDQVSSALGISDTERRKRRMIAGAVRRACEKGDPAPTVALGMIAAVKEQDALYLAGELKFTYGLQKFLGLGIWRERSRWPWDMQELQRRAQARQH